MPGFVLHVGAIVHCAHGGQAVPASPNPKVLVSGQPVVTMTGIYNVTGCPFTTPAGNPLPCVTGQWVTGAVRVFAGGQPLLLLDSQSKCVPNGTPLLIASTQTRVIGT